MTESLLKRAYLSNGFAVSPPVHDAVALERAVVATEHIQRHCTDLPAKLAEKLVFERTLPAAKRDGLTPEATGDAIFIIGDPPAFDPLFAEFIVAPDLVALVRDLLGTHDIRCHFSNVTMKRGRVGSGIGWHRDFPNRYVCPSGPTFLRVMICLDGMDEANGATRFVSGSHRVTDAQAAMVKGAAVAEADGAHIATAVCGPGALVFIHPKSVHGGPPNASPRHRRNLIVQWGRADDPPQASDDRYEETLGGLSVDEIRDWVQRAAAIASPSAAAAHCR
ncbi:MAG TPA: phytanoyl-CoA dioxygenase family protein [Xanthobacteraceae bacterium]|nr:phytanoyl-CoA dioxygenase family protein [Xanthobacteraceae bacterium]